MTPVMISLLIGMVLLAGLFLLVAKKKKNRQPAVSMNTDEDSFTPPNLLGIHEHLGLHPLIESLESALQNDYVNKVKARIKAEDHSITEAQWDRRLLELKRFFTMAAIFKEVPMYHAKEDQIWHEMLMFTSEYHKFSHAFCGQMIHHKPTENPKPDPGGKAWYEFCYSLLFGEQQGFFQHKIPSSILSDFKSLHEEALIHAYFVPTNHPIISDSISRIIREIKYQIHYVETNQQELQLSTSIPPAMAFLVWTLLDKQTFIKPYQTHAHAGHASSSCGSFLSSCSSGDSSGSSCGSCGGGCGS